MVLTASVASAADSGGSVVRFLEEFPASEGDRLQVELLAGGTVAVSGWDRSSVSVKAEVGGEDPEVVVVESEEVEGGVRVHANTDGSGHAQYSLRIEIKTPRRYDLDFRTEGGDVEVEGLRGEVQTEIAGGDVSLVESRLTGRVTTRGGDVALNGVTGGLVIATKGGDVEVLDAPEGVDVETEGGDVLIRSARGMVRSVTSGGDITVDEAAGCVKAIAAGGEVAVTLLGTTSDSCATKLEARGGEVRATLSAGLSLNLDVELVYTRESSRDYEIDSDFPLELEHSEQWDEAYDPPRKTIRGRGMVGGGEHPVLIRTVNGDVKVTKVR